VKEDQDDVNTNTSDSELPSRTQRHGKKRFGKTEHALKKAPFWQGRGDRPQTTHDVAFYEALESMREQASTSALPVNVQTAVSDEPKHKKRRFFSKNRIMFALLCVSLLGNVGSGALVYKLLKNYEADKNKFATTDTKVVAPKPVPDVVLVNQVIHWNATQKSAIAKERRTEIEERLSMLQNSYRWPKGSMNFLFAASLNNFTMTHDGVFSISAFLNNGYLRGYTPKKVHIEATLLGLVIFSGDFENKVDEMLPGEVYLADLAFKPDDIRDPETLDKLIHDPSLQAQLKFDVRMSYENLARPDIKEELWMYMNTQAVMAPALPTKTKQ
jgi:hypothetical protein